MCANGEQESGNGGSLVTVVLKEPLRVAMLPPLFEAEIVKVRGRLIGAGSLQDALSRGSSFAIRPGAVWAKGHGGWIELTGEPVSYGVLRIPVANVSYGHEPGIAS